MRHNVSSVTARSCSYVNQANDHGLVITFVSSWIIENVPILSLLSVPSFRVVCRRHGWPVRLNSLCRFASLGPAKNL